MNFKTIIVLAKSEKNGGYCVAGRELIVEGANSTPGNWIRPVSSDLNSHGAIFDWHFHATGHNKINVLDVVKIPVIETAPEPGHPENILIDMQRPWKVLTRLPTNLLDLCVEQPKDLWLQPGYQSSIVPAAFDDTKRVTQSLYVVKPSDLRFRLTYDLMLIDQRPTFKKKIWALFSYNGQSYCLTVTDPKVKSLLSRQYPGAGMPANEITLKNCNDYILCLSLTPRFGSRQHHYKLVTTVFDFGGHIQEGFR